MLVLLPLAIVENARIILRKRFAATLRNLRSRHRQNWQAAADRAASPRLRLQMRPLQPDHVGGARAAARASLSIARLTQRNLENPAIAAGPGFIPEMPDVKLRPHSA